VIKSCIRVLNLYGMHHQGIFRIPGSQVEINDLKTAFEKGALHCGICETVKYYGLLMSIYNMVGVDTVCLQLDTKPHVRTFIYGNVGKRPICLQIYQFVCYRRYLLVYYDY